MRDCKTAEHSNSSLIGVDAVDPDDIQTLKEDLRRARIREGAQLPWPHHRNIGSFLAS
jgi:hypothetical protein